MAVYQNHDLVVLYANPAQVEGFIIIIKNKINSFLSKAYELIMVNFRRVKFAKMIKICSNNRIEIDSIAVG